MNPRSSLRGLRARLRGPGKNLDIARQELATLESAEYINQYMADAVAFTGATAHEAKLNQLQWAVQQAPTGGIAVEFGVASGETLRLIASQRHVHGFDSFEGLPEDWYGSFRKGAFAQPLPTVDNAELHVGWFEESLSPVPGAAR